MSSHPPRPTLDSDARSHGALAPEAAPVEEALFRPAAVLVLVYPRSGHAHVVFTQRTQTVATHRGQISLPGGSRDPSDPSLEFTALRETEEELGVPSAAVRVLGPLAEVETRGGYFRITPFVGVLFDEPVFRPQLSEVAEVIEVPLAHLCDPSIVAEDEWEVRGAMRTNRFYRFEAHRVWGATALVIADFLESPFPESAAQALTAPRR